ncbi:MAG: TrbI/VirB10 family protein [Desulfuromusa sp.]|nr:TrbI/VirB10 family protein [Desulfuromusa sp.]
MSQEPDPMAPDASPETVSRRTGVRRVNSIPMILVGVVVLGFLIVMMLVAQDRNEQQNKSPEEEKKYAGNTAMFANEIAGNQTSGIIEPATAPPMPELDRFTYSAEEVLSEPTITAQPEPSRAGLLPATGHNPGGPSRRNEEAERIRMAKMQMFQEALRAGTRVTHSTGSTADMAAREPQGRPQTRTEMLTRLADVRRQIDSGRHQDPNATYQARLAQIQPIVTAAAATAGGPPSSQQPSPAGVSNNSPQISNGTAGDRWTLHSRIERPESLYELRAGFVIPGILISGINSALPGQIEAQVSQNVYDTATGKYLLLPQGARLVGTYSSDVAYGQARVLVSWQRISFPDGKAMDIGSMPGADIAGFSGLKDKVNNHYLRTFGSAILMSAVVAGVNLSQDDSNGVGGGSDKQRASDAMSEALGQQLGQVMTKMISKNLNISPTLTIRPGKRFNIVVTKDITFSKPYQSFDY